MFTAAAAAGARMTGEGTCDVSSDSPRKLIEIVPGASTFHSEYVLLAVGPGAGHMSPGTGTCCQEHVIHPRHAF